MVTSVSNVSPAGHAKAMDKISQEQLYSPGDYALQEILGPPPRRKKKGGFFSFVGKTLIAAVVIGGAAVGVRKGLMKDYVVKTAEELAEASHSTKIKNYFAKGTDWIYDSCANLVTKAKNIFRKEAAAAEDAAEGAADDAAAAVTKEPPAAAPTE